MSLSGFDVDTAIRPTVVLHVWFSGLFYAYSSVSLSNLSYPIYIYYLFYQFLFLIFVFSF